MSGLAVVTVASNEVTADLICSFLRKEGILCNHRITNIGAGAWDGVPSAAGPREVVVDVADLDHARRVLAAADLGEFSA
jgi:hypothetical protein